MPELLEAVRREGAARAATAERGAVQLCLFGVYHTDMREAVAWRRSRAYLRSLRIAPAVAVSTWDFLSNATVRATKTNRDAQRRWFEGMPAPNITNAHIRPLYGAAAVGEVVVGRHSAATATCRDAACIVATVRAGCAAVRHRAEFLLVVRADYALSLPLRLAPPPARAPADVVAVLEVGVCWSRLQRRWFAPHVAVRSDGVVVPLTMGRFTHCDGGNGTCAAQWVSDYALFGTHAATAAVLSAARDIGTCNESVSAARRISEVVVARAIQRVGVSASPVNFALGSLRNYSSTTGLPVDAAPPRGATCSAMFARYMVDACNATARPTVRAPPLVSGSCCDTVRACQRAVVLYAKSADRRRRRAQGMETVDDVKSRVV